MPLFGETAKRAIVTLPYSENISPLKPHGNAKNARRFSFHQRPNRNTYFCNQSLCLESLNQIICRTQTGRGAEGHRSSTLKLLLDADLFICFSVHWSGEARVPCVKWNTSGFFIARKVEGVWEEDLSWSYCSRFLSPFSSAIWLNALQVEAHSYCLMCIYNAMWLISSPARYSQQLLLVCWFVYFFHFCDSPI